jgi:thiamine biosynthesis lipoprotein
MERSKVIRIIVGLLLVLALAVGIHIRRDTIKIEHPSSRGATMGTAYSVQISGKVKQKKLKVLGAQIDAALEAINQQMSTWDPKSEISRFNHSGSTDPIEVSPEFSEVVRRALAFSQASGGAFDPTLQPLLNLWGFGSEGIKMAVPDAEAIAQAKALTGWEKIQIADSGGLQKNQAELSLALGAIAKGYGVDTLARILDENGFENWFVEIGGEVVVRGMNPSGMPWKIGIQYPDLHPEERLQGVLHISSGAVATSGDYRNYLEKDGVVYSHILDPRSGKTVLSDTASVTVYASNCTDADALATALFVMGPADGLTWVEQMPEIEALFLVRDGHAIIEKFSSGFEAATGYIHLSGKTP